MSKKVQIAIKRPSKILLIYEGVMEVELDLKSDFENYILTVEEKDLHKYEKIMVEGEKK